MLTLKKTCQKLEQDALDTVILSGNLEEEETGHLAEAVVKSTQIRDFSLTNCYLSLEFCSQLVGWECSNLTRLDLSNNSLTDDCIEVLCGVLEGASSLQSLILDSNEIGDIGACALAEILEDLHVLSLSLCHNRIRDLGAEALSMLAVGTESLTEILCYDNTFGDRGRAHLGKAAFENRSILLRWLDDEDDQSSTMKSTASETCTSVAHSAPSLGHQSHSGLSLGQQTTLSAPMPIFGRSPIVPLRRTRSQVADPEYHFDHLLEKLEKSLGQVFTEDPLTEENVEFSLDKAFLRLHYRDETLKCIDLAEISEEGAISICAAMQNHVQELCLTYSSLTKHFCGFLNMMEGLRILDLGGNNLGDDGAEALCEHWSKNLKFLNLSDNCIGNIGACAIAEVGETLDSLCICENQIGDLGAEALVELSPHLDYLFCWDNAFGYPAREFFEDANHNKLYWVKPYHWELELETARDNAQRQQKGPRLPDNLRKKKEKTPTSTSYNAARKSLEKSFDPNTIKVGARRPRKLQLEADSDDEKHKDEIQDDVKPLRKSSRKRIDKPWHQGKSVRNWKKEAKQLEKNGKVSVPRSVYRSRALNEVSSSNDSADSTDSAEIEKTGNGSSKSNLTPSWQVRETNKHHNRKRRDELQRHLSGIQDPSQSQFQNSLNQLRELERRLELPHQHC